MLFPKKLRPKVHAYFQEHVNFKKGSIQLANECCEELLTKS